MKTVRHSLCSAGLFGLVIAATSLAQVEPERSDDVVPPPGPGVNDTAPSRVSRAATLPDDPLAADSSKDGVELSPKERAALALAKRWMAAPDSPVLSDNGQVRFLFGATLPVIVCAPLRGTDIALQPGEIVKPDGVHTGDTVRWQVMPSVADRSGTRPHT